MGGGRTKRKGRRNKEKKSLFECELVKSFEAKMDLPCEAAGN